ncbi:hypothetical protein ORD22_06345 [Sporosarcina sp. GW1-11]|uniref:hypothetical protein n=1 Tax=Sporosarcina sp. GW1-11 TaxID=2899126 RepID=UPI00294D9084|nr:hypothetical protein [Sporosarcina sp. GW1-11]MDV6377881.1 hypothetical protein [Sporosarcina sp. GW1-11]
MNPGEAIYFFLLAVAVVVVILLLWLICRKRKKLAIVLTSLLVISYIGYYLYYPTLKINTHAERYGQLIDYLVENYPDKKLTISPEHYENGHSVGQFDVNDVETPTIGVTFDVSKEGQVKQIGTWSTDEYPTQQELWREVKSIVGDPYTLEAGIADITKEDEWIDALTIDHQPAIALFSYSKEGYSLLKLQQGERGKFVVLEERNHLFVYVDERYKGETVTGKLDSGKAFTWDISERKGQLLVEKQQ